MFWDLGTFGWAECHTSAPVLAIPERHFARLDINRNNVGAMRTDRIAPADDHFIRNVVNRAGQAPPPPRRRCDGQANDTPDWIVAAETAAYSVAARQALAASDRPARRGRLAGGGVRAAGPRPAASDRFPWRFGCRLSRGSRVGLCRFGRRTRRRLRGCWCTRWRLSRRCRTGSVWWSRRRLLRSGFFGGPVQQYKRDDGGGQTHAANRLVARPGGTQARFGDPVGCDRGGAGRRPF